MIKYEELKDWDETKRVMDEWEKLSFWPEKVILFFVAPRICFYCWWWSR